MLPTQPILTNEEGVQPQLLESFQVPSQVLDSIISERVIPEASASSVVLVRDSFHQELRPTAGVNGLIKSCRTAPCRERESTHPFAVHPEISTLDDDRLNRVGHLEPVYSNALSFDCLNEQPWVEGAA